MKKSLFIMALGAIALTSCSQDEVIEVKQDAIAFSAFTENASRADVKTQSDINDFNVYAYVLEDEEKLYFNEVASLTGGIFKTSNTYYWPSANVDFYCVWPSNITLNEKKIDAYEVVNKDTYHNEDLLYSVKKENSRQSSNVDENGVASINFRHALAMVEFKFENSSIYDLDLTVNSLTIKNIMNKRSFALPTENTDPYLESNPDDDADGSETRGTWTDIDGETADFYQFNFTSGDPAVGMTIEANDVAVGNSVSYFVMPQELVAATATVGEWANNYILIDCKIVKNEVTIKDGNVAIPISGEWVGGYKYTYTFKFGEGAGFEENTETPVVVPIAWSITVDEMQVADPVDVEMVTE